MNGLLESPNEVNTLQSFSDTTAGRSLQLYYGVTITDSTGVVYALTRDGGFSNPTSASTAGGTNTYNFDITINKMTIVSGYAFVDLKVAGDAGTNNVVVSVVHYNGSTETTLGSVQSEELSTTKQIKLRMLLTKKAFGVGKILRLKIVATATGGTTILYNDPNVAGDELKLWLPVVNLE